MVSVILYRHSRQNFIDELLTVTVSPLSNSWPMQTKNKPVSIKPATSTSQYDLFQIYLFTSLQATPNAWYGATPSFGSHANCFHHSRWKSLDSRWTNQWIVDPLQRKTLRESNTNYSRHGKSLITVDIDSRWANKLTVNPLQRNTLRESDAVL